MNDSRASRLRLTKYILPVVLMAFLFNIPKFFEAEVKREHGNDTELLYIDTTWYFFKFFLNFCLIIFILGLELGPRVAGRRVYNFTCVTTASID